MLKDKENKDIINEKKIEEIVKDNKKDYTYKRICPNCGSADIIVDKKEGEIRCAKCGTIIEEKIISTEKEWRTFGDESLGVVRSSGSIKESEWDKGLTTKVEIENTDIYGVPLPVKVKIRHARLKKLQNRIKLANTRDRNFFLVMSKIDRILNVLNVGGQLEHLKNECAYIYKKAMEKNLTKRKNYKGMAVAIIYFLCVINKIPFQFITICKAGDVKRNLVRKYIRMLRPVIDELYPNKTKDFLKRTPDDYINKFADKWNLPPYIEERAKEILKLSTKKGVLSGRSPAGFAAAALLIAAEENGIPVKLSLIGEVKYITLIKKKKLLIEELEKCKN